MIRTHLKIAFRNLLKYKSYTLINILGLALGLVAFLGITLYVLDEFSFDRHHEKKDRIYRAIISAEFDGQVNKWGRVPNQLAPASKQDIPEVEKAARYFHHNYGDLAFLSTEHDKFTETQLYYADQEFFDIFSVPFVKGDQRSALTRPGTVVLSERAAALYFPGADPIGQVITVNNNLPLEVTGVYQDFPSNSSLKANLIASFSSHWFGRDDNLSWGNASFETFFLLQEGAERATVDRKIEGMLSRQINAEERWFTIYLQPLTDIRLGSGELNAFFESGAYGDRNQINILMALAIIILLIAAVNYMNMATAQSQRRHKEVGIAKTLGATLQQLNSKFYFETSLLVLMAMLFSLAVFTMVLPGFNEITGKHITTAFLETSWFWMGFVAVGFILTLLAGFYPAWYLSSFSPKASLHQKTTGGTQVIIRKGLVVFQFAVSMVLIICSVVFFNQMKYIRDKKLGYEPEQVIAVMTTATRDRQLINTLKTEFESLPEVKSVSGSQSYPGIGSSGYTLRREKDAPSGSSIITTRATHEILDVLGIKLLAGRTLPEVKDPKDTTIQVVLNKSAVDYLGLTPDEAIGQLVYIFNSAPAEVVGVTEDFHFNSLHQKIGPYCFNNNTDNSYNYLLVKVETTRVTETIQQLEGIYNKIIPAAFDYSFIDDRMAALYQSEQKLTNVVTLGTALAIFIACLGLYALAAYSAGQRTKEIGIRKVMGASVVQLVALLSKEFLVLVGIAVVIGIPLGYFIMNKWLEGFAYKTTISTMVFIVAAFVSLVIAALTVSYESIRAARANPASSLRSE